MEDSTATPTQRQKDAMIKSFLEGKSESSGNISAYRRVLIEKVEKTKVSSGDG